jgi:TolB protein
MNIDGSGKTLISSTEASYTASNGEPSFSPDGAKVAFQSNRTGSFEVYRVGIDGSGLVQLTTTGGDNYKPQYLPNGQILFYSQRDGRPQLYTMEADGSNQIKLSDGSADDGDSTPYSTEKPSF